jgi:uncharacterized membrane protein
LLLSRERPIFSDLKRSRLDIALEVVALVLLTTLWATTIYYYPQLPRSIPRHFDASGEPNAWGSKSSALILPIASLVLYTALTVLNRFPHRFNYPWPITEGSARSQYALARQLLSAIKASIGCIFTYINWATIETGLGNRQGLGAWFLPTTASLTLAPIVVYFYRARRLVGLAQTAERFTL